MNTLALGTINAISQGLSVAAKRQAVQRLDQLGLHLLFSRLPAGWIPAMHVADLTPTWQGAGLDINGVSYSTIGALIPGSRTSARFWPTSPFYQARLGGYLLACSSNNELIIQGEPAIELLMQTVLIDQAAWVKNYGCPDPRVSILPGSFQVLEATCHQDHPAWVVEGTICSNSDIGAHNRSSSNYIFYRTYELMFQRFGGVRLPALCTLPPTWPLASYHNLELDYLGLLIQVGQRGHWALLLCCGARWGDRDCFAEVKPAALTALQNVRIVSA